MSLQTDIVFIRAIQSDASLIALLDAGDVYNTFIPVPDEEIDNVPLPYVIVAECDVVNDGTTKDDYEGDVDNVMIEITVAARTRVELAVLTNKIRKAVHRYFMASTEDDDDHDLVPLDYLFGAKRVEGEPLKPCVYRILTYQCEVKNDTTDDHGE